MLDTISSMDDLDEHQIEAVHAHYKNASGSMLMGTCRQCFQTIDLSIKDNSQFGSPCSCADERKYIHNRCLQIIINRNQDYLEKKSKEKSYDLQCTVCGDFMKLQLKRQSFVCQNKATIEENIKKEKLFFIILVSLTVLLGFTETLLIITLNVDETIPLIFEFILFGMVFVIPFCFLFAVYKILTEFIITPYYRVIKFKNKRVLHTIQQI